MGSRGPRRSPCGPFNRNPARGRPFPSAAMWPQNPLWKCENLNILSVTVWYKGNIANQITLPLSATALLLWHKMNCPTEPVALCSTRQPLWRKCGAHDPAWNRKWAGKATTLVRRGGSFLRLNITTVVRDQLFSVTHLRSICFQSTGHRFGWWLHMDGPRYVMWEDHKVLCGYKEEE